MLAARGDKGEAAEKAEGDAAPRADRKDDRPRKKGPRVEFVKRDGKPGTEEEGADGATA